MTVKRLQIMIEEELDAALELQAREERTSKAALIRRYVRERLGSKAFPPLCMRILSGSSPAAATLSPLLTSTISCTGQAHNLDLRRHVVLDRRTLAA